MESPSSATKSQRLRILAITRIFPNRLEPLACPFQRQQFVALSKYADVTVMAAIPTFPGARWLPPKHRVSRLCHLPEQDIIAGLPVIHARIPYLPRVGPLFSVCNAPLYAAGLWPHWKPFKHRFDVILGAFLFPDAWAAAKMAAWLGLPYVVKAHGTDVNVTAESPWIAPLIRNTLRNAHATIAVSRPMVDSLITLGALSDHVHHVPNGVDRALFTPQNKAAARQRLGWSLHDKRLLFVGRLEKEKGLLELLEAHRILQETSHPSLSLVIAGTGSLQNSLASRAQSNPDILCTGERPPEEIALFLAACDVLVLPSWAEGTPNVILEAFAVGRPVVACNVGGIPDVVCQGKNGFLVAPKNVSALVTALNTALHHPWNEHDIVLTAPPNWDQSGALLHKVLQEAANASRRSSIDT